MRIEVLAIIVYRSLYLASIVPLLLVVVHPIFFVHFMIMLLVAGLYKSHVLKIPLLDRWWKYKEYIHMSFDERMKAGIGMDNEIGIRKNMRKTHEDIHNLFETNQLSDDQIDQLYKFKYEMFKAYWYGDGSSAFTHCTRKFKTHSKA